MRDIIITSSILITAIFLIRHIAKDRINPLLQYSLWLLVALKLLIPIPIWSSPVSVLNLFPGSPAQQDAVTEIKAVLQGKTSVINMAWRPISDIDEKNVEADILHNTVINDDCMADGVISDASLYPGTRADMKGTVQTGAGLWLPALFILIWFVGMIAVGGYMIIYQVKWRRYLRINRRELNAPYNRAACALGINLPVYIVNGLPSPCLSGRSIYLTETMAADEKRLRHILAHEYCHYRHLDSVWVYIRCILTVIYWFNPLVWAAAYASKQDSEFACDAAVIRMLGEDERIDYAKTLINLITGNASDRSRMGMVSTMSSSEKGIRERICKIAGKRKYIAAAVGVVALLAAGLAAVTFSGEWKEDVKADYADNTEETENNGNSEQDVTPGTVMSIRNVENEAGIGIMNNGNVKNMELTIQQEMEEIIEKQKKVEEELSQTLQAEEMKRKQAEELSQEIIAEKKEIAEEMAKSQIKVDLSKALKAEEIDLPEGVNEPEPWESAMQISYINPCPSYTRISDGFGVRVNPITKEEIFHSGVDMAAEQGVDIVAAAEGAVYKTGYDTKYGNYVIIYHGMDNFTYYTCCDEITAAEGDRVTGGQKIATVGSTGTSTGPHLHFMTSANGEYVEPVLNQ